jgi:hypothetical protein
LILEWNVVKLESNAPKRQFHTACTLDNFMYIFGGGDGKFWLNDLYKFDLDEKVWTLIDAKGKIPSNFGYL